MSRAVRKVGIVNYGMGNIWSLSSALRYLGSEVAMASEPGDLSEFSHLVLPGVGSFRKASDLLTSSGLAEALVEVAKAGQTFMLGICLGMQLMAESSPEGGDSPGLSLLPASIDRFSREEVHGRPIPHVGFAPTQFPQGNVGLFGDLNEETDFYYVHSFRLLPSLELGVTATCDYGVSYLAGFDLGNICGTQFHPEKSQSQGLQVLRNFLSRNP